MFVTWLIQLTVLNQQPPNIVSELAKENLWLQPTQRTVAAFILLYFSISEMSCSDGGEGWGRRIEMVFDLKKQSQITDKDLEEYVEEDGCTELSSNNLI